MTRLTTLALGMVVLLAGAALAYADTEGGKKPLGTWKRSAGDTTITFEFKGDSVRCTIVTGDNSMDVSADYGLTKDGVVFGRVNKVTKKGMEGGPSEGDLFSFRVAVEKEAFTLSELKAQDAGDDVKQLFEGEYKKEKDN